jgi:SAM-dependent methyltransferase
MAKQPNEYQKKDLVSTWDAVSAAYDETAYWQLPENHANLETILRHFGDPAGKRVIEIGCGSGFTTLALARRGARCALLDISSVALETSTAAFVKAGLAEPERYLQDALNSNLPSDTFDLVWNGGVIEHFADEGKKKLMKEMVRICAPGGQVLILVPNRLAWQFQLRQALQKLRGTWIYGFEDDMSPGRLLRMAHAVGLDNSEAYAFNPIAAWRWLPRTTKILRGLGVDTLEHHMRRSLTGMVSILVIKK